MPLEAQENVLNDRAVGFGLAGSTVEHNALLSIGHRLPGKRCAFRVVFDSKIIATR